ncbi:MAG TPA: hypothetical protein VH592_12020 [Gemmataceae bacterium]|jgi:hypothetical protein
MTQSFCLQSFGSLRQFGGGQKVIKMQSNVNQANSKVATLASSGKGGKVEVAVKAEPSKLRPVGLCRGQFTVPDDFDDPLPDEILEEFDGQ